MALTYSPVDIRGKAAEPVISELFFQNKTIKDGLVSFETDVKYGTVFTENTNTVVMQAYTAGAPTANGTLTLADTEVIPAKCMFYTEFTPDTLRPSRFNKDMKSGAWETTSSEFEKTVLLTYAGQVSADAEYKFWNGILTAATRTAIAALTASTTSQERAWAAAQTDVAHTSTFDGVVAKLIKNHIRSYVSGTTITSSNIATEYAKLYADMDEQLNDAFEAPVIYAPKSHKQLINIYNSNATYRDLFSNEGGKYFYNGIEIKFVPLDANILILTLPSYVIWCTDLVSDVDQYLIDKIAPNRDDMFIKFVFTLDSHVVNQKYFSLYVG